MPLSSSEDLNKHCWQCNLNYGNYFTIDLHESMGQCRAGVELRTPGYAVRRVSVVRQVTKCTLRIYASSEGSGEPAHLRKLV